MWALLEYDRIKATQSLQLIEQSGIQAQSASGEEELGRIDVTVVDLLLVGAGWQKATIDRLRDQGLDCKVIHVASNVDDSVYATARELRAVDVVQYPLSMEYLRRWAPVSADAEVAATIEHAELSKLEQIVQRHNSGAHKTTYTRGEVAASIETDVAQDVTTQVRGRVVAVHSARGGVGKSMMISLLARHLSARNFSVAVVDLDPKGNFSAIHRTQAAVTTDDWARLPAQMDERMTKQSLVKVEGFYLLPSGKQRSGVDAPTMRRIFYHLSQFFDVVLVDTTPSLPVTDTAIELANQVVYVMTPEWVSFKRFIDEYEMLRRQKTASYVPVVINRIRKRMSEHLRTLRLIQEANIPSDVVQIPEDKQLYQELLGAAPLNGSREVKDAVEHLLSALRFDPKLEEARQPRKKWRFAK